MAILRKARLLTLKNRPLKLIKWINPIWTLLNTRIEFSMYLLTVSLSTEQLAEWMETASSVVKLASFPKSLSTVNSDLLANGYVYVYADTVCTIEMINGI